MSIYSGTPPIDFQKQQPSGQAANILTIYILIDYVNTIRFVQQFRFLAKVCIREGAGPLRGRASGYGLAKSGFTMSPFAGAGESLLRRLRPVHDSQSAGVKL